MPRSDVPGRSRSMTIALGDLALDHLCVVYSGSSEYSIADDITAIPVAKLRDLAVAI